MNEGMQEKDFDQAQRETEQKVEQARQNVALAEQYSRAAHSVWNKARQQSETVDQRIGADEAPITAPPPPESLPAEKQQRPQREDPVAE
jgi:hypothetical protein